MVQNLFKRQKSLSEEQEDRERLDAEDETLSVKLSIAQKRVAIKRLKERGLTPKHFGDTSLGSTWQKIWQWLKTH